MTNWLMAKSNIIENHPVTSLEKSAHCEKTICRVKTKGSYYQFTIDPHVTCIDLRQLNIYNQGIYSS